MEHMAETPEHWVWNVVWNIEMRVMVKYERWKEKYGE